MNIYSMNYKKPSIIEPDEGVFINEIRELVSENRIHSARQKLNEGLKIYPDSKKLLKCYEVLRPPKIISNSLPAGKNRKKERQWLKKHSDEYKGNWVALYDDILIAKHPDLKQVLKKAKKKYQLNDILLHFIPK